MKAQLAERVAGIISARGSKPMATPTRARIGSTSVVVAVLLVSSVRLVRAMQTVVTATSGAVPASPSRLEPMASERPDLPNPAANAKPPPKSSNSPHGRREVACHVNRLSPGRSREGSTKRTTAPAMATAPSPSSRRPVAPRQPRSVKASPRRRSEPVTQSSATAQKTAAATRSSGRHGPRAASSARTARGSTPLPDAGTRKIG
jgi:hypothetical protein